MVGRWRRRNNESGKEGRRVRGKRRKEGEMLNLCAVKTHTPRLKIEKIGYSEENIGLFP